MKWANKLLEPAAPTPPVGAGYTRDFYVPIQYPTGGGVTIREIAYPCAALGLHGYLPPGAFAIVVPKERRGDLAQFFADADTRDQWSWGGNGFDSAGSFIGGHLTLPEDALILYPGDVVPLGKTALNGVSIWVSSGIYTNPYTVRQNLGPEPYVRVFTSDTALPARMGYRPIPLYASFAAVIDAAEPPGAWTAYGAAIYGCTHVRITFRDNAAAQTPVQAGESGSFNVFFMNAQGLWMHHETDDFDAGGRGAVSSTHVTETYEIPAGALAVCITRTAGANDFYYSIEATDLYGAYRR